MDVRDRYLRPRLSRPVLRLISPLGPASSLVCGLLLAALVGLLADLRGAGATQGSPSCQATVHKMAEPRDVVLGGQAAITLTTLVDCSSVQIPVHVALVFDNSTYMGGQRINDMRRAVEAFVESVDFGSSRVGLAAFSGRVENLSELTDDPQQVIDASQSFFPNKGSDVTRGLRAGRLMLERGRSPAGGESVQEVIVLFVGSPNEGSDRELLSTATELRDAGVLVVTVAATGNAELDVLEAAATAPTFFHVETMSTRYATLMRRIAGDLATVSVTGAQLVDMLPANMEYVWGSGVPAPRINGQELRWRYDVWPVEGLTVTYEVEPQELGCHPTNVSAQVELEFDRGDPKQHSFPVPTICVAVQPTVTATSLPATATPTPTRRPHPVYLPTLWRDHCRPEGTRGDVVLIIDTSSSMLSLASQDRPRLYWAQEGASRLIDGLYFPGDAAAVLSFSADLELVSPLSSDRGALHSAVARLLRHMSDGSDLAPALRRAGAMLAGRESAPGNTPLAVVITDGFSDPSAAIAEAQRLRAAGVAVFALGIGEEIDATTLAKLAVGARQNQISVDGLDLGPICSRIARELHCGLAGRP